MKKLAALIVCTHFLLIVSAQSPCLPEGITFTTQEQINSFQVNYPGCTDIEGDVTITLSDIYNLNGLSVLTTIDGSLVIFENDILTNLTGLEGLTSIGGSLAIFSNYILTNLTGLENLTYIGENLSISGDLYSGPNPSLITLEGLEGLTSIGGHLLIGSIYGGNDALISLAALSGLTSIGGILNLISNNALTSLTGLENITSVPGHLWITGNGKLTNLIGLENLTFIDDWLSIEFNNALTNLTGLDGLISIEDYLRITNNDSLTSLTGLENLMYVKSSLIIKQNELLTSLSGLDNIDPGLVDYLFIYYNPLLSECHIQSICDYLVAPNGTVTIEDNAPGCNSIEEVEEACLVDIEDHVENFSFTITPNPSVNSNITIALDNTHTNLHITCFNTFGQQIHHQEISRSKTVINVSSWQPGIYLAVLYENGKPAGRAKFVVR